MSEPRRRSSSCLASVSLGAVLLTLACGGAGNGVEREGGSMVQPPAGAAPMDPGAPAAPPSSPGVPPVSPEPTAPSDPPATDPAAPTPPLPQPSPACMAGAVGANGPVQFQRGAVGGSYLLHVPPTFSGVPMPLVINLHGQPGTGAIEEQSTGMSPVSDDRGFVVVYPDAVGQGWASGAGPFSGGGRDDVAFISALIDDVGERHCIATNRVYLTGHSAGAFMTYRLACELADKLAAVSPVAGAFVFDPGTCSPTRALPLLHIHGTADPRVPYDKSSVTAQPPGVQITPGVDSVHAYAARIGCAPTKHVTVQHADWTCESFDGCPAGADVTLCSVAGMGHSWPGGDPGAGYGVIGQAIVGPPSSTFNAGDFMWETFFQRFAVP